jgi:hypothetical protein
MNALAQAPSLNTRTNIIAGPGPRDYFFHSPGAQIPMINEEGPFPVQGNVGSIIKQEATDFSVCGAGPSIGSSPNCTGAFVADAYTVKDTCGASCLLKNPESYGEKDFGFQDGSAKISDAHQVHAFSNLRAGAPGQMSETGCVDWVPNVVANPQTGTCELLNDQVYDQVGAWNRLPMYKNLQSVVYTPWK